MAWRSFTQAADWLLVRGGLHAATTAAATHCLNLITGWGGGGRGALNSGGVCLRASSETDNDSIIVSFAAAADLNCKRPPPFASQMPRLLRSGLMQSFSLKLLKKE